ncbi:hypothetical protein ECP03047993_4712 [Escherichia coli P0304799.3]|nr:hypothetical protein ECP03047993_4712 [Escherichia coli P0304799.3]
MSGNYSVIINSSSKKIYQSRKKIFTLKYNYSKCETLFFQKIMSGVSGNQFK